MRRTKLILGTGIAAIAYATLATSAAAAPRVELKSFQTERTIQPGKTSSVSPSCRRGFQFHATRFRSITPPSSPSDPRTHPVFELLGMVPEPKGTRLTLRNVGSVSVRVRATVDCIRTKGKIARPTAARTGAAQAARKSELKLSTYVREKVKRISRGNRARAAKTKTLKLTCNRENSIPADIGFKSRRSEFAGADFIKRKGDLGMMGRFRTEGPDKLRLYVACLKGKRVKLKGTLAKGGLSGAPAADADASGGKPSGGRPRIPVRYGRTEGTLQTDFPFTGLDSVVDTELRSLLSPPFPVSLPSGAHLIGRGFLDAAAEPAAPETPLEVSGWFNYFPTRDLPNAQPPPPIRQALALGLVNPADDLPDGGAFGGLRWLDRRTPDSFEGPVVPECSDGVDNGDLDGLADAADPGCQTGTAGAWDPDDVSERDKALSSVCPHENQTITGFLDFNNTGVTIRGHAVSFSSASGTAVHQGDGSSHGPLSLGPLCGANTDLEVSFTGGSGRLDFRIINPSGSGTTGGGGTIRLALNER